MKLLRSLAVYLYVAGKVVYGARYFEKLEKQKDVLGEAVVAQKVHAYAKKWRRMRSSCPVLPLC